MEVAIEAVEQAFRLHAQGQSVMPIRGAAETDQGILLTMPAALQGEQSGMAVKVVSVFPKNVDKNLPLIHASVLLNDAETGQPLALMEGSYLTGLRTGAASGVAAKYLVTEDVKVLGVIGCGYQAFFQVWALSCVRSFDRVVLFNRSQSKAETLKQKLESELNLSVVITQSVAEVTKESDVLITSTSSTEPVFNSHDLNENCTVIAIGAFTPKMRETDDHFIQNADLYVDDIEAALHEAGDLLIPMKLGLIRESDIRGSLGDLVTGKISGRESNNGWVFFKSVGLAIEDVAAAQLAYHNAKQQGLGTGNTIFKSQSPCFMQWAVGYFNLSLVRSDMI